MMVQKYALMCANAQNSLCVYSTRKKEKEEEFYEQGPG